MFYLIGIGLKPGHLTLEAKGIIEGCDKVFLDTYTSAYSEGSIQELEALVGREVVQLDRKGIEEDFGPVLREAKASGNDVGLLVFGNALSATTHVQLLLDAKQIGIEARVLPGISIYDFLGSVGLDQYRFGRTCTIVLPKPGFEPESFYDVIESNFENGLHTLCLLDIDAERNKMMTVGEALNILLRIEKKRGKGIMKKATLVGLFGIGSRKQMVKAGSLVGLQRSGYALFPQSLVVAAKLTDKEKESLEAFS